MSHIRIHVLCPDLPHSSGGLRKLYRHVDVLNANGYSATIVHQHPGYRANWFANDTWIIYPPLEIRPEDVLVFPEIEGPNITQAAPGIRKVIINQNAYYTFGGYKLGQRDFTPPYLSPDVLGTIVVSEDSRAYLSHVFPQARIYRIHYGIDPKLYYPQSPKKRQICFMPRKRAEDAQQVLSILRFRNALVGFQIVPIQNKTAEDAAAVLRESMIFLSFGHPEGFGLPAAEAMACGCIVIGYHGMGGREFLKPDLAFPIEVGDIIGFARTVEQVIRMLDDDASAMGPMTQRAAEFIRTTYSPEIERNDIVSCWRQILRPGNAT